MEQMWMSGADQIVCEWGRSGMWGWGRYEVGG